MSDISWRLAQFVEYAHKTRKYADAGFYRDCQNEITRLQSELEKAEARVAQIHDAAHELYSWCVEHLTAEQTKSGLASGHKLGQLLEFERPSVAAFVGIKQAEAVEEAARQCMPGPCGSPDDPPAGYQEYCEGVASVREYAQRLRQRADKLEKGETSNG